MLYLKLDQALTSERSAIHAMQTFAGFHGVISPRRVRAADGSEQAHYVVLVPAGRRADNVRRQLVDAAPYTVWTLVDVDADGYETACVPTDAPPVRQ